MCVLLVVDIHLWRWYFIIRRIEIQTEEGADFINKYSFFRRVIYELLRRPGVWCLILSHKGVVAGLRGVRLANFNGIEKIETNKGHYNYFWLLSCTAFSILYRYIERGLSAAERILIKNLNGLFL